MFHEAEELLAAGHDLAAVLLARASVDAHLRGLLRAHDLPGYKTSRAGDVRRALLKAGVIDAERDVWIERKMRVANRAAHGAPFDRGSLAAFVRFAGEVLEEVGAEPSMTLTPEDRKPR